MRWQIPVLFFAVTAIADASSIMGGGMNVDVRSVINPGSVSDAITYTSNLVLIIGGGAGSGFFEPIATVRNTWSDSDVSRASVQITCGTGCAGALYTDYSFNTVYDWNGKDGLLPFIYGVPISLQITMSAADYGSAGLTSEASLNGFTLFDPGANRVVPGGTFTIQLASTQTATPEPGSFWLLAPFAGAFPIVRRRNRRLNS